MSSGRLETFGRYRLQAVVSAKSNAEAASQDRKKGATMRFSRMFSLAAAVCVYAAGAQAQDYPNRAIHMVVPYAPGGGVRNA